jgi:hypothetical protein
VPAGNAPSRALTGRTQGDIHGEFFTGFLPNVFTTDVTDGGLKVNGIELPNTSVPAPVV